METLLKIEVHRLESGEVVLVAESADMQEKLVLSTPTAQWYANQSLGKIQDQITFLKHQTRPIPPHFND